MAALEGVKLEVECAKDGSIDEFLECLNIPQYKVVYVSFGSYQDRALENVQHKYIHSNPNFLKYIGKPYLCISIDPRFTKLDVQPHINEDGEYTFVTIPVSSPHIGNIKQSIDETKSITQKIVERIPTSVEYVFFVNFIKFASPNHIDIEVLKAADEISSVTGRFKYYDWGGFNSKISNFIMEKDCSLTQFINAKLAQHDKKLIDALESGSIEDYFSEHKTLRAESKEKYIQESKTCLLHLVYGFIEPNVSVPTGSAEAASTRAGRKRKRTKRKRTKRSLNLNPIRRT